MTAFTVTWHRWHEFGAASIVWAGLTELSSPAVPWEFALGPASYTIAVHGTWGTGGAISVEGSADGLIYLPLIETNNAGATYTANGGRSTRGSPRFIRPRITAGTGVSLTVTLFMVRGVVAG